MNRIKEIFTKAGEFLRNFFSMNERDFQTAIFIVLIILVNIAGSTLNLRFDLTRNESYSLSDKSKEVVSELKEKLKVRVLFSGDLPAEHAAVYRYLKDLLEEYDYYGNRYFSYELVDPEDLEKQASSFGIQPVSSREFVDDQVKIRRTYMGVVIQHADLIEKLDMVVSPDGLEYKMTSLIEKMTGKIDGLLGLKEPVKLTLYLDSNLGSLPIDGIDKVQDIVKEAVQKSNLRNNGKIVMDVADPSVSGDTSSVSELYGIQKLRWGNGKTPSGKRIKAGEGILGIVIRSGDRFKTIELSLAPTLFGNYAITGLRGLEDSINEQVGALLTRSQKVGYVTAANTVNLADDRSGEGGGLFEKLLSDMYEIESIDLSADIPDDLSCIIVNGPKSSFTDEQLYRIDQFLMKGKGGLFFIDSFNEIQAGGQNPFGQQPVVLPVNTGVEKLLSSYGVTVKKNVVLDKSCSKVNLGSMIKDYPVVPVILRSGLSRDSLITRHLNSALFVKAAELELDNDLLRQKGAKATELVNSSEESWIMQGRINFNPHFMDMNRKDDLRSYPLSALVTGRFDSFYRGKPLPVKADEKGQIKTVKRLDSTIESSETKIIVTGTSEITRSGIMMYARKILSGGRGGSHNSNDHLLHSMVDYLAGNHYVPEMMSKSLEYNPLEKTEDSTRFILKAINIGGVPFFVILAGIIVWRARVSRKKRIQAAFSKGGWNE